VLVRRHGKKLLAIGTHLLHGRPPIGKLLHALPDERGFDYRRIELG
jgi:hypothetical protein